MFYSFYRLVKMDLHVYSNKGLYLFVGKLSLVLNGANPNPKPIDNNYYLRRQEDGYNGDNMLQLTNIYPAEGDDSSSIEPNGHYLRPENSSFRIVS